jgi:thymidylate kinase
MVPLIESCDLLVLDRYKWSYIVRWACRDVRWSVLTAVGSLASLVPEPAHTLLLDAEPFAAHRRKMVAGITLSPSETLGRRNSQSSREAFVNLQTRAAGYYDKLFEHAPAGSASRFDSALGQDAVGQQALQWLNAWLGR